MTHCPSRLSRSSYDGVASRADLTNGHTGHVPRAPEFFSFLRGPGKYFLARGPDRLGVLRAPMQVDGTGCEDSGTIHTPLPFSGLRRFVYLVLRGAGRWAELISDWLLQ